MYLSANASRNTCLPSSDVKLMRCSGRGLRKYEGAGVGAESCSGNGESNGFVGIETGAVEDDEVEDEDGKDELKNLHCCWMTLDRLPFASKALVDVASGKQNIDECWSWFAKLSSTTRGHNVLQLFVSIFSSFHTKNQKVKRKRKRKNMRSKEKRIEEEQRLFS